MEQETHSFFAAGRVAHSAWAVGVGLALMLAACGGGGSAGGEASSATIYVKASNTGASDEFGRVVAVSADGTTLAVAADRERSGADGVNGDQADNNAESSGAVYVYVRGPSGWEQQAYVKASNSGGGDRFGSSIALSADGSALAVGARREDSAAAGIDGDQADNSLLSSGAVYLFSRQGVAWSQSAYVKASNTAAGDQFGGRVALSASGQMLAVGATSQGIGGGVYVFERIANAWMQAALLKASNEDASDLFGSALALAADGSTLAVGARGEDSSASGVNGNQANNSEDSSGAVYVFTRMGLGIWSQPTYLKASNPGFEDLFGQSVDLSADGNILAVGASWESSAATGVGGDQSSNAANSSGAAYVFVRAGAVWSQQAYIKASNTGANDAFGRSLALSASGQTLAVGAERESSNAMTVNGAQDNDLSGGSGAVHLFQRDGNLWSQSAYVKAPDNRAWDAFGTSVDVSADGSTLLVGAPLEDSNATGINGNRDSEAAVDSGSAYLFFF